MARLKFSQGSVAVEMDDTLERLVRRALDKAAPGVVERITAETDSIQGLARRRWPVLTGRSRAGLRYEVLVSTDSVRGRIMNDVEYAPYVRPKWLYGSTTAWESLVRSPMRKASSKLMRELGPLLRRALQGQN